MCAKKNFDFIISFIVLLITFPLFFIITILIKLSSKGSIFFKQERIGKDGKIFTIYKFRTMIEQFSNLGPKITSKNDFRITQIGKILRQFNLDKLPMFFNVLKQEMSIIGPCPEIPEIVNLYSNEQRKVFFVKPGILSPSQILQRRELEKYSIEVENVEEYYIKHILPLKLEIDIEYVKNACLKTDIKYLIQWLKNIILNTFNLKYFVKNKFFIYSFLFDLFLVEFSYFLSCQLFSQKFSNSFLILIIYSFVFIYYKMYQSIWKYIKDFVSLFKSMFMSFSIIILLTYFSNFYFFSKSVLFFNTVLLFSFLLGIRLIVKFIYQKKFSKFNVQNILIAGIDEKIKEFLQNLNQSSNITYNSIGFVDEDIRKIGEVIEGIKVLGTWYDIPNIVSIHNVKEIFIFSKIPKPEIKTIIEFCKKIKINYKIIPCVRNLLNNKIIYFSEIRNIEILDILERESINLDFSSINNFLQGKNVLVTGAGGSIGSELCKQIYANYNIKSLTLIDKTENYLYEIESELENIKSSGKYFSYLCDITCKNKIKIIFEQLKPDIIFHAAAYKHVHLAEKYFIETIENNIFGTKVIADLANEFGVNCFVMISTDKAVKPISIMGVTKRIAELYIQNLSQKSNTKYLTVRFGNVLNSKGSVIPLFQKQIEKKGPITITHPEMERYFMTIPESVHLILQSATLGEKQEIFILDMGKPIKIIDLCKEMIKLSGYDLEKIPIKFIGLRPGEKLSEELFEPEEKQLSCSHPNIKKLKPIHFRNDIEEKLFELQQLIQTNPSFNQTAINLQKIVSIYRPRI